MNYKRLFDPIYGDMEITDDLLKIIDTLCFKRLKHIKQLGLTHHTFPSAVHTRFEHSIGTMHLSNLIIDKLNKNSKKEYEISKKNRLLINIGGLCHDIGHGPFSHLFDKITKTNHEHRSCEIVEYLLPKLKIKLTGYDLDIIKNCINPPIKKEQKLIYNIIANKNTELDVDKFDYIKRDTYFTGLKFNIDFNRLINQAVIIDKKICYPLKLKNEILDFFYTRYSLYKDIYNHKMHSEKFIISEQTTKAINKTKREGNRVICVGTTSLRALESSSDCNGFIVSQSSETDIFITPGYQFKIVDCLITNFHTPKSTLIMLVSAFSGVNNIKIAYKHAIDSDYRFFSYGDVCWLDKLKNSTIKG